MAPELASVASPNDPTAPRRRPPDEKHAPWYDKLRIDAFDLCGKKQKQNDDLALALWRYLTRQP